MKTEHFNYQGILWIVIAFLVVVIIIGFVAYIFTKSKRKEDPFSSFVDMIYKRSVVVYANRYVACWLAGLFKNYHAQVTMFDFESNRHVPDILLNRLPDIPISKEESKLLIQKYFDKIKENQNQHIQLTIIVSTREKSMGKGFFKSSLVFKSQEDDIKEMEKYVHGHINWKNISSIKFSSKKDYEVMDEKIFEDSELRLIDILKFQKEDQDPNNIAILREISRRILEQEIGFYKKLSKRERNQKFFDLASWKRPVDDQSMRMPVRLNHINDFQVIDIEEKGKVYYQTILFKLEEVILNGDEQEILIIINSLTSPEMEKAHMQSMCEGVCLPDINALQKGNSVVLFFVYCVLGAVITAPFSIVLTFIFK